MNDREQNRTNELSYLRRFVPESLFKAAAEHGLDLGVINPVQLLRWIGVLNLEHTRLHSDERVTRRKVVSSEDDL